MPVRVRTQAERRDHFITAWRERAGLRQYQLAERIGMSAANLSRVETKEQPYTQDLLEAIEDVLKIAPEALIGQDPADATGMWDTWAKATPEQRSQIAAIAKTLVRGNAVA